jgi:hypothetical protein
MLGDSEINHVSMFLTSHVSFQIFINAFFTLMGLTHFAFGIIHDNIYKHNLIEYKQVTKFEIIETNSNIASSGTFRLKFRNFLFDLSRHNYK